MDDWIAELRRGQQEPAWDLFLDGYRGLLFAAIRHYVHEYDDVMDVFTYVCDELRTDDLRRLRVYVDEVEHRARFSTWLVTVVQHLTIDWLRRRDGRSRPSALARRLPPLRRQIFEGVFVENRTHIETYELIRARDAPALTYREFLSELRETYRDALADGHVRLPTDHNGGFTELEIAAPVTDTSEATERLNEALMSLTSEDRLAVQLYAIEDLPAADVARVIGLPGAKAVYKRVYRALHTLREYLARAGIRKGDL
ncbi:MAG: sigma-70 family RNA polymerase sigma factor [Gemmatimonadetes bacterium]|nr:sigma-70 family RNA polymerase sigma factor [Gemmatimonadota bacterium]